MGAQDLGSFDWIVVSSSAGKDSQAMLDVVVQAARLAGVLDRVVVVHADLGRVEWKGTVDLAREHADHYGLRFITTKRKQGDLLDHIEQRGKFPSSTARYCTSDHKRGQIARVYTQLALEHHGTRGRVKSPCRILNCMGFRAEESPARAKRSPWSINKTQSNGRRAVHDWLPIFTWSEQDVWDRIRAAGTRHHSAYDLGVPRLSCVFCIFAPKAALTIAGRENPELLAEYVRVEQEIGHDFRQDVAMRDVAAAVAKGEGAGTVDTWGCQ